MRLKCMDEPCSMVNVSLVLDASHYTWSFIDAKTLLSVIKSLARP
jgi:hypothetical protein